MRVESRIQAGSSGATGPINRIVPLPRGSGNDDNDDDISFDDRILTLYYDNAFVPGSPGSVLITGRFLGVAASPINVTVNAGECDVVAIPDEACAATLHIDEVAPQFQRRGPVSALVEYDG